MKLFFLIALIFCSFCIEPSFALVETHLEVSTQHKHARQLSSDSPPKIDAVLLTTAKDGMVFERAINSALTHLVDVNMFYVITPSQEELSKKYASLGERVVFIAEQRFNFTGELVADTMLKAVKDHGIYPLNNGNSQFEKALWGKIGWHLQQLLKLYAGKVLNLNDYVLIDGDCVWYKDIKFISTNQDPSNKRPYKYYYTTSTQYHGPYLASSKRISGIEPYKDSGNFRSGVVHHMVLVKEVLNSLFLTSEKLHGNKKEMWEIMLSESALEMTCRAPRPSICGAGSTLSEYELYLSFARTKYPNTVELRPLLWANGPMPGLIYWPDPNDPIPLLSSDSPKHKWLSNRGPNEIMETYERQMASDRISGYDFIGYHGYAKRRYFELHKEDIDILCKDSIEPFNTTCSYRGLDRLEMRPDRTPQDWFKGCGCFMAKHAGGQ
jgi:hypothetical protein